MSLSFSLSGLGPDINDPLYGLFDLERNIFYRVDFRKSTIEHLHDLANSHRKLAVMPIDCCANWHRTLVDNSTCNHWGLSVFTPDQRPNALLYNEVCLVENYINIDDQTQTLIGNLAFVTEMLNKLQSIEYQFEHQPLTKVEIMFADDAWVKQSIEKEFFHFKNNKNIFEKVLEKIKLCAQQLNIDQDDYCDVFAQQIQQITLGCDQNFFKNLL